MSAWEQGSGFRRPGSRRINPLYERLPKGPHGMTPRDVVHNQRLRIHGGMIEGVARHGYKDTSVADVLGFARVSRRAFYEQFKGKEDCFLRTLDLIVNRAVKRTKDAYLAPDGPVEKRLRAALGMLVEEVEANPKALRLVLVDAMTASPQAQRRVCRVLAMAERALAAVLPAGPAARMAVGGLFRVLYARLLSGRLENRTTLCRQLLEWVLLLATPELKQFAPRPARGPPWPPVVQLPANSGQGYRARLEDAAINLVLRQPYDELSGLQIADEAGVSLDVFLDQFLNPPECYQAALDRQSQGLLEAIADPALVSTQWPTAVCHAIDRLTTHLVENPATTVTLGAKTLEAGPDTIETTILLGDEIATLLTEGAPRRHRLAPELISGALSRTTQAEVLAGRGHQLDTLNEHLAYMVLAPYLGAEEAGEVVIRGAPRVSGKRGAARSDQPMRLTFTRPSPP